ncbi:MAG TPA: M20/M25/M40 family metallo-hydrolase [Longimicrobiales bacterium]|nr:M20/M25/M40 family metallo-hydrolase [Longimicrobiales bacterium]
MRMPRTSLLAVLVAAALAGPVAAQAPAALTPERQLAHDVYKELIEINTSNSVGDNTAAANAMAKRLIDAGFPAADVKVLVPDNPKKGNLVARMRGKDAAKKPILLLAHLDVVEAKKEDWSNDLDPFQFTEREGYYYGRGTSDDKAMAAIWVANLIRFKKEGFVPDRDIILALTADEEGGCCNGVHWLLENHADLVNAEFGLNEGGGGELRQGKHVANKVGTAEKVYQDFTLEVTNPGGHSSVPKKDNAIYALAAGLSKIAAFSFPAQINETTKAYFDRMGGIEGGQTGADMKAAAQGDQAAMARLSETPVYNSMFRTTCVATLLAGGHAPNALPQRATANVNCRMFPGADPKEVQATLQRVVADTAIKITAVDLAKPSPPSPLRAEVFGPIEKITKEMWPGTVVVPTMGTGATDGLYFRQKGIPVYGVSGLFSELGDGRAHGRDERVSIKSFYDGQEFLYRLVKAYTGGKVAATAADAR